MKCGLITFLAVFIILPFTPWWMTWVILGVYGWSLNNFKQAILYGAEIGVLVWGIKLATGYFIGGSILMEKISVMINLGSTFGLITVSLFLAAMLGMLSCLSGFQINQLYKLFFSTHYSHK